MANKAKPSIEISKLTRETKINQIFDRLNQFVDPDVFLTRHGGRVKLKKMMYDDAIHGAFETRYDQVLGLSRSFQGPNDTVIDFVKEAIGKDCLSQVIRGAMECLPFGYSVTELVWDKIGTQYMVKEAMTKPFEWYSISRKGELFLSETYSKKQPTPWGKYVLTRHRPTYEQPYGQSILSRLYFAYDFRCHGWDFWVKFLEKFGNPIIWASADMKISDPVTGKSNLDEIADHLSQANRPTAIVMGKDTDFKVFNPAQAGNQFQDFITAVNKRIQIAILGQTLTTDTQGVGSQALGNVHNLVREDKKRSDVRMVQESVNSLIEYVCELNEIDKKDRPEFFLEDERSLQSERANRDSVLTNIGVRFKEKYVSEHYDLSEEDFDLVEAVQPQVFSQENKDYQFLDQKIVDKQDAAIESLSQEAADVAEVPVDMEELLSIIRTSKTQKDMAKRLSLLIGNDSDSYNETLTDLLFQARVQGFIDAGKTKGS